MNLLKEYEHITEFVQKYFEDILIYFKTLKAHSFSRLLTREIGWTQLKRDEKRLNQIEKSWFKNLLCHYLSLHRKTTRPRQIFFPSNHLQLHDFKSLLKHVQNAIIPRLIFDLYSF
jgi:hypothetical protein